MSLPLLRRELRANYKMILLFTAVITLYSTVIIAMYDPKLGASLNMMAESMPELFAAFGMTNAAVSYTHLDVYKRQDNSILGMMNLLGGGALQRLSVFALGVTPYITASIIIQLMSMDVIPALTEMAKSGQQGRMKMDKITRYMGVVFAFIQAFTMVLSLIHL